MQMVYRVDDRNSKTNVFSCVRMEDFNSCDMYDVQKVLL